MHFDRTTLPKEAKLRVRITEQVTGSIDGIQLERFSTGFVYDVGTALGSYLLSVGSAEPVLDQSSAMILPIQQQLFALSPVVTKAQPLSRSGDSDRRPRKKHR